MKSVSGETNWNTGRNAGALAGGGVVADTGPQPKGLYDVTIHLTLCDLLAAGVGLLVEHRNGTNTATVKDLGGIAPGGGGLVLRFENYRLGANERIRVVGGTAATSIGALAIAAIGIQRVGGE